MKNNPESKRVQIYTQLNRTFFDKGMFDKEVQKCIENGGTVTPTTGTKKMQFIFDLNGTKVTYTKVGTAYQKETSSSNKTK